MSTPAISHLVRHLNQDGANKVFGAILLTASHNPGGPQGDFGIKFNMPNGGPAPERVTNAIFEASKTITEYPSVIDLPLVDLNKHGEQTFQVENAENIEETRSVTIVDTSQHYVHLMKELFDFDQIKKLVSRADFSICFDGMHGIAGPYATTILQNELNLPAESLMRCNVLTDFGGAHPDPNLTYAPELVQKMGIFEPREDAPSFGAACDGDADRNMILGKNFFVTPSDSVAFIVAQHERIPYLKQISGAARSMPTSRALDNVCTAKNLSLFETPTGWKFFGNLLDAGKIAICGEESFGTGSNHVREKDGLWAVLCWLQILADVNKDTPEGQLVTVQQMMEDHWKTYGRNYYQRYDYESLPTEVGSQVFDTLEAFRAEWTSKGEGFTATNFSYTDPVTNEVTTNQGYIFGYPSGSRFVFRLSGTGSSGATVRVYLEQYSKDSLDLKPEEALKQISEDALKAGNILELTGMEKPTVIT